MVAAFPVFKLGALFLKQITRPLANIAKAHAMRNQFFRTYICIPPAQVYNWCEARLVSYSKGLNMEKSGVPKLSEEAAIELGAELVGETLVFLIASSMLTLEYRRYRSEAAKEKQRLIQLESQLQEIKNQVTLSERPLQNYLLK